MCGGSGIKKNPESVPIRRAARTRAEVVFAADLAGTYLRAANGNASFEQFERGQLVFQFDKTNFDGEPDQAWDVVNL
jgi:hypothetical protein